MKGRLFFLYLLIFFEISSGRLVTKVFAQNMASGHLIVDDVTTVLNYIYFDQYNDEYTIILTDNPVEKEMIPDGLYALSEQGKIRGLEFTVSRKTQDLLKQMRKAIYFYPVWIRNIDIGSAELTISKFDESQLEGSIKTISNSEYDGHDFSYDIAFSLSLKKKPSELKVSGKNDAPSKAYAAYCRALLDGDVETFKKYLPKEKVRMMPEDQNEVILGIEFVRETMMTTIEIVSSTVSSDKAVLELEGKRGIASAKGRVTLIQENGQWKINEESWRTAGE